MVEPATSVGMKQINHIMVHQLQRVYTLLCHSGGLKIVLNHTHCKHKLFCNLLYIEVWDYGYVSSVLGVFGLVDE